jgi:UrcA family protein
MKTLTLTLSTLAATVGLTATAQASVALKNVRQQVVSYADLNLQNAADSAILRNRIKSAARVVCGVRSAGPMPIDSRFRLENCVQDATARAVADVGSRTTLVAAARE